MKMKPSKRFKRLRPENAIGIPLEEIDPKVSAETFCVISSSWSHTRINRYDKNPSLFLFYPYSLIRRASIACTTNIAYDIVLAIIITINMVDLIAPNTLPLLFERVTFVVYIFEAIHQSISSGFVKGRYSYLRNPYMCFDFMITLLSIYNFSVTQQKRIEGLQLLRGFRILEIITKIPGVRLIIRGLALSIQQMMSVTTIIFIFLVSIAIAAKRFFRGIFYNKCVKKLPTTFPQMNISYFDFIQNENNWLLDEHYRPFMCGNITGANNCDMNFTCLPDIGSTPFENISNFDTFGLSMLNSLRLITTDTWDLLLNDVNYALGPVSAIFFVPVVLLGSFYLRNLMLIVVTTAFKSAVEAKKEEKDMLSNYSYYSSFPFDTKRLALYPLLTTRETLNEVLKDGHDMRKHREDVQESWEKMKNILAMKQGVILEQEDLEAQVKGNAPKRNEIYKFRSICWKKFRNCMKRVARSVIFERFMLLVILINAVFLASVHADMSDTFIYVLKIGNEVFISIFVLEFIILFLAYDVKYFLNWFNIIDFCVLIITVMSEINENLAKYSVVRTLRLINMIKFKKSWNALRQILAITVDSICNIFRLVIMMTFVIFVFGVITNKFLGPFYKTPENGHHPARWTFSNLGGSAFIVLNVFTGEWIDFLFECMELSDQSALCPFIFITMYVIGNLVVASLFAALLLSSFDSVQFDTEGNKVRTYYYKMKEHVFWFFSRIEVKIKKRFTGEKLSSFFQSVKENKCFVNLRKFAKSNTFEGIIIFLVFYSCIVMALDEARVNKYSAPKTHMFIKISSILLAVLFFFEMVLRWIGIGIKKYFSDPWIILDFIILIVMFVEVILVYGCNKGHSITSLMALRALRPLRFLNKLKGMETIVGAFVLSMPSILRVIVVCLFFWLPFAILGVHLFAGKFFRCEDFSGDLLNTSLVYNKTECLNKKYTWANNFQNFDHIGNSYMVLFQVALFGNWADLSQLMVDYKGNNIQPVQNSSVYNHIFMISFLLVGGYFSLNLFIGLAVDTFQAKHKRVKDVPIEQLLTKAQMTYYRLMRKIGRRNPVVLIKPPSNPILKICYKINNSWWFRITIFLLICANTITIAISSHKESPFQRDILRIFELCFIPAYCLEFLIKILALRKHFFNNIFNIQDLFTLIAYFIGEATRHFFHSETNVLAFLYAFRIIRVLRLLRLNDIFVRLRLLMYATIASISPLFYLSLLLTVIIFIYAIIGISLFGHVKYGDYINSHTNFENVQNSMILLFRLTTSEGWEKIYEGLSIQPPHCQPFQKMQDIVISNCGNKWAAAVYLVSFIFLTNIILVNIFIAVILDNYREAISEEEDIFKEENLISFNKSWRKFDPNGTQFLTLEKLSTFLDELIRDLKIEKPNYVAISYMQLRVTKANEVHVSDVLQGILKVKTDKVEVTDTFRRLQSSYEDMFPELKGSRFNGTTMDLKRRDFAARTIQRNFKKFREAKLTMMEIQRGKLSQALSTAPHRRLLFAPSQQLSSTYSHTFPKTMN